MREMRTLSLMCGVTQFSILISGPGLGQHGSVPHSRKEALAPLGAGDFTSLIDLDSLPAENFGHGLAGEPC